MILTWSTFLIQDYMIRSLEKISEIIWHHATNREKLIIRMNLTTIKSYWIIIYWKTSRDFQLVIQTIKDLNQYISLIVQNLQALSKHLDHPSSYRKLIKLNSILHKNGALFKKALPISLSSRKNQHFTSLLRWKQST